jgi:hypothetical protein
MRATEIVDLTLEEGISRLAEELCQGCHVSRNLFDPDLVHHQAGRADRNLFDSDICQASR